MLDPFDPRVRRRWRMAAAGWTVVLLVLLFLPGTELAAENLHLDKVFHFAVFLVFGVLTVRSVPVGTKRGLSPRGWTVVAAGILAVLTEAGQHGLDVTLAWGRSAEVGDALADVVGAAIGSLTAPPLRRRRRPREKAAPEGAALLRNGRDSNPR